MVLSVVSLGSKTIACTGTFGRSEVPLPWKGVYVVPLSVVTKSRPTVSGTTTVPAMVVPSLRRGAVEPAMYTCPSCAPALKCAADDGKAIDVVLFIVLALAVSPIGDAAVFTT